LDFFTGTTIKCLDNNATILNASKTAMNINVNTTISSNTAITGNCVVNGTFNQSKYYTLKGLTWNVTTSTSYGYTKFFW